MISATGIDKMLQSLVKPKSSTVETRNVYRKKTQGAVGTVNGPVYNIKLLVWYLLHCHSNYDTIDEATDFVMLSEWIKADLVDDIVLFYGIKKKEKHTKATFMQLKYRKNSNTPITKTELIDLRGIKKKEGDFCLKTYYKSFCNIIYSGKFEANNIKHIAIVTNVDLDKKIKKYFEEDFDAGSVLKLPRSFTYKLKLNSSDQLFLEHLKINLGVSPSQTLVNKMYKMYKQQTASRNALTSVGIFETYRLFLSKYVLEPNPENFGYLRFKRTFVNRDYGTDASEYSQVIDEFRESIKEKFKGTWKITDFKASKPFYIANVPQLEEDEIPPKPDYKNITEFMKKLRIVKTVNDMDLSDLIKDELSAKFNKFESEIAHDLLFVKMLNWYRDTKGVCLTSSVAEKWLNEIENLFLKIRNPNNR